MEPIRNFDQLTSHLKTLNKRKRIAVVCANDPNTEYAIARALDEGIAEFLMIGDSAILEKYPTLKKYPEYVQTLHIEDKDEAAREAVRIVREGGADILMKGIINTDNLLHAILDKEKGLLPKGKILTHLAVMQIPTYDKLLFFSDAAVIPRPTLQQRIEMIWYAIHTCHHSVSNSRVSHLSIVRKGERQVPSFVGLCQYCGTCRGRRVRKRHHRRPVGCKDFLRKDERRHQRHCISHQRRGRCLDFPEYRIGQCFL